MLSGFFYARDLPLIYCYLLAVNKLAKSTGDYYDLIDPYGAKSSKSASPTKLCGIGDEMSELNIQRRLNWWRECNPSGIIKVSQESVNADPALQRAILELPYIQIRKPRE